jgi:hypothetical protein
MRFNYIISLVPRKISDNLITFSKTFRLFPQAHKQKCDNMVDISKHSRLLCERLSTFCVLNYGSTKICMFVSYGQDKDG